MINSHSIVDNSSIRCNALNLCEENYDSKKMGHVLRQEKIVESDLSVTIDSANVAISILASGYKTHTGYQIIRIMIQSPSVSKRSILSFAVPSACSTQSSLVMMPWALFIDQPEVMIAARADITSILGSM